MATGGRVGRQITTEMLDETRCVPGVTEKEKRGKGKGRPKGGGKGKEREEEGRSPTHCEGSAWDRSHVFPPLVGRRQGAGT